MGHWWYRYFRLGIWVAQAPTGIIAIPAFPSNLFGQAFVGLGGINGGNIVDFLAVLLVFLFVDMFDTVGTLMGVGTQAGYIDDKGELPRANQALSADAITFDRAVTLEDKRILESTDYDVPLMPSQEEHLFTDRPGIMIRKKVAALLKAHGEIEHTRNSQSSSSITASQSPVPQYPQISLAETAYR